MTGVLIKREISDTERPTQRGDSVCTQRERPVHAEESLKLPEAKRR